jgi:hypothetical protein
MPAASMTLDDETQQILSLLRADGPKMAKMVRRLGGFAASKDRVCYMPFYAFGTRPQAQHDCDEPPEQL